MHMSAMRRPTAVAGDFLESALEKNVSSPQKIAKSTALTLFSSGHRKIRDAQIGLDNHVLKSTAYPPKHQRHNLYSEYA